MAKTLPIINLNILGKTITFSGKDVIEAEVIQEIHPVSIEIPASTARIRLWLDDTREYTFASLVVTGAGALMFNKSDYVQSGFRDGKPRYYTRDDLTGKYPTIIWVESTSSWYLSTEGSVFATDEQIINNAYYVGKSRASTPNLVEDWKIVEGRGVLPTPTITLTLIESPSLREKFSPFGDGEYYQALAEGLVVDIIESIDDVEKAIGRFYTEDWSCPREGELEIICSDLLGIMDNKNYLGNFFENPTRADAIIADIMAYVGVGYTVDPAVGSKLLKGYLPGNVSLRESLQQVLFAAGAYASTSGSHKLNIKQSVIPVASSIGELTITNDDKTDTQKLKLQQKLTGVTVMSHDYFKSEGVVEEIFSAYVEPGDYLVVYPKPYWHVEVLGTGDSLVYMANTNDELIVSPDSTSYADCIIYTTFGEFEFGANHVFLHVPSPGGQSLVIGKPWHESTQLFEWASEGADAARANVWKIDSATLVSSVKTSTEETAVEVLARVVSYAKLRYQQEITLFPFIDVDLGKIAVVDSLHRKKVVGIVEKMSSDLTGGYLIGTEIIGLEHSEGIGTNG